MTDSNTPPSQTPAPESTNTPSPSSDINSENTNQSFGQKINFLQNTTKAFFDRLVKSDFQQQELLESEVSSLDASGFPKKSLLARNFLAWRRGLLWIAGISLIIAAVFSCFELVDVIEEKSPGILTFILIMFILAKAGASFFIILAAQSWTHVKKTKKFTRLGWMCMFIIPFAVSMIPVEPFLDTKIMGPQQVIMTIGVVGLFFLITLLPMVLGLFPGLIRSSLALKTLIPESPMPGWIAVVIAPLYALFFIIALMIAVQAQSFLAIIGLAAFSFAPITLVMNTRKLTSPTSASELNDTLRSARKKLQFYNLVGTIAIIVLLLTKVKEWDVTSIASFVSNFLATILLVTVATSDILLSLFHAAFNRQTELNASDQLKNLEDQFADLETLGLTDLNVLKDTPKK